MPVAEELSQLKAAGVGAIVSVFHDDANLELYQQSGIPSLWLPIAVNAVPTQEQMQEFQAFVDDQSSLGHRIAVHCSTGKHRTGTMLASYLIAALGSSYENAMKAILNANPDIELPETQTDFLEELAQSSFDSRD